MRQRLSSATIRALRQSAIVQLDQARIDAPAITARLLLSQVLSKSGEWLSAHGDEVLNTSTLQHFDTLLKRVIAHEPLAYVLGHREFYGLDLIVDHRVLIPRPETEMLVELAIDALRPDDRRPTTGDRSSVDHRPSSVVDVGTGSGAVAIAVAKHAPSARIIATDISAGALDVAKLNAERHGVSDLITFLQANLLEGIDAIPTVITANLPYVTHEEIEGLPMEIQEHEPRVALDGGEDGLELVRRLLKQIATIAPTSALSGDAEEGALRAAFLEIGASQGRAALDAAGSILLRARVEIKKDLAKLDRVLCITFV